MRRFIGFAPLLSLLFLTGCAIRSPKEFASEILPCPSSLPPQLNVYVTGADTLVTMDAETYLAGVLAGEMPNTWPMEALKAQAILARTYTLKFITEKDSRYPGADISTDITEAQAYDASAINPRILQAVQETAGLILRTADGTLPYTWFHSHSGGMTESAIHGIDWQGEEPSYIRITRGCEDDAAAWSASFTRDEFIAACRDTGANVRSCSKIAIVQKGKSGRVVTLSVDGTTVNAARLRISLGSTRMRSTLLTDITPEGEIIRVSGRGYGHGVGMSQWGARALALRGWTAEEIILHYYKGLHFVRAW